MTALLVIGLLVVAVAVYLALIGLVLDLEVASQPLQRATRPLDTEPPVPRSDVSFEVDGTPLSAWLYPPQGTTAAVPCIVLGHGFCGTKDAGLDRYARRFQAAGFAVLAFDYRYFGRSGGEPRQLYWIPYQLQDWAAAVDYARGLEQVDPGRIALWGSSASGGHVLVTAARDRQVACVSAQCPGLDPRADGRRLVRKLGLGGFLRLVMHAQRDMFRSRLGLSAHRIPIVGPPGSIAFFANQDAYDGYSALAPEGFVNEVCARVLLRSSSYRPIEHARDVRCPVLLQICERDELASPAAAEETAARLGQWAQVERYPIGHFDIYQGPHFERAVLDQVAFFQKHLQGGASPL